MWQDKKYIHFEVYTKKAKKLISKIAQLNCDLHYCHKTFADKIQTAPNGEIVYLLHENCRWKDHPEYKLNEEIDYLISRKEISKNDGWLLKAALFWNEKYAINTFGEQDFKEIKGFPINVFKLKIVNVFKKIKNQLKYKKLFK